ncbi:hypothetical protein CEE37_05110 [candidate division LCP-89 bacterium B3_LCP]|uniref:Cytochrome C Planctomycete-type domain-containing protein n=1 Tax=candidate division LCP-89 bacterium B3_LCP TaxID=2012998 RepID=A0A532V1E9_UNCL8|nr:MAG: hypothetical protein CEE37_05110 [candidate division LCP-89 bacterium B3_LCP]
MYKMKWFLSVSVIVAVMLIGYGCDQGSTEFVLYDIPICPGDTSGGGTPSLVYEDLFPLLNDHCWVCHQPPPSQNNGYLDLTVYEELMNAQTTHAPLVIPGEPDSSYFLISLTDSADVRMPPGGPYLAQSAIDSVYQWIADGASGGSAVQPGVPVSTSLSLCWEDSTKQNLIITMTLPAGSQTNLDLSDQSYSINVELINAMLSVGTHQVIHDFTPYAPGIYGVSFSTDYYSETIWFEI